jgi:hypothetical protein
MNKVFYRTLISHAKKEIKNLEPLLIRADNDFLTEKSIDGAIKQLREIEIILLKAKQSYKSPINQTHTNNHLDPYELID